MSGTEIHGVCDDRFAPVRAAFEKNFELGLELGASFALAIEGEFVVDLWAGHADRARTRPWRVDTIAPVYSTSKIVTALCGLIALDRGLFELDEPVARYWPEFGAAGKSEISVRWLFCHASGVAGLDPPVEKQDVLEWDRAVSKLAAQAPWWEPGTQSGYHGFSFCFLIGELIRRTSGLDPNEFLRREVTEKIDADFQFGLRESDVVRQAEPEMVGKRSSREVSFGSRVVGPNAMLDLLPIDDPSWRRCMMNGYGNARSLAKMGSILASGGSLYGHSLLSRETARLAHQEQIYTHDLVMDMPIRFGLGFGLASDEFPLPFPNAFHWGGFGGSSVIMEPDSKTCWSYVPTRLDPAEVIDPRGTQIIAAACVGVAGLRR